MFVIIRKITLAGCDQSRAVRKYLVGLTGADYDNAGAILENIMLIMPLPEFLTDV